MAITPLPAVPLRSDAPATFVTKADAFLGALNLFATQVDAVGVALTLGATNATSTTSLAIGLGSKSLTVQTGKSYVVGMTVKIASTAVGSTWMLGDITSYTTGTGALVVTVTSISGSGTLAAWTISQSAPGGAQEGANADITSLSGLTTPLSVLQGGTGVTTKTGTGAVVLGTSPTLASPTLASPTLTSPVIAGTPSGVGTLIATTAVASTSGTSIDFTGIPNWVKRITVMLQGVSTTASSDIIVRIGATVPETSGYLGCAVQPSGGSNVNGSNNTDNGFCISPSITNTTIFHGTVVLTLLTGSTWIASSNLSRSDASYAITGTGSKVITGTLGVVRLTTVSGTDTFDTGSINIMYE